MTSSEDARRASSCAALDIGATKVEVGIVHSNGEIGPRGRLAVADHPDDLFEATASLLGDIIAREPVGIVGVGCAGPMTRDGEQVSPLNIVAWRDFPLRERLRERFGDDVHVEGDARALALAEGEFGAAKRDRSYLSMVVSTGVGGGIVIDGRLLNGDSGNAGHIGHLIVVPNGAMCSCGAYGCLEAEASGWSIESRTGRPASEADQATRERTAELVGRAVGTLASVLDFTHCYVAGSVALGFGDEFFQGANKAARRTSMLSYTRDLEIRPSGLGVDGPLLGAAVVGWRAGTQ